MTHFLRTDRVILRKLSVDEPLDSYLALVNDAENLRWTDLGVMPFNAQDLQDYIRNPAGLFLSIFSLDGTHVGNIQVSRMDHRNRQAELGMIVARAHQRKGYGLHAVVCVTAHAFEVLNLNRLYVSVVDANTAARALYARLGFREEGVERGAFYRDLAYHDVIRMSLLAREYPQVSTAWPRVRESV